ncbi:MAG: hypothetical protein KatS3mg013_1969 [Actinomycetota bacterium]|nr:MAG: hypothetical protein KatS3mg013_1969 [Actinomycetota bacterium]
MPYGVVAMGALITALLAVLIIVGIAAVVLAFGASRQRSSARGSRAGSARAPRRAPPRARSRPWWLRLAPLALLAGAIVSLGLAVARFTVAREERQAAVVIAMDVSESMTRTDVAPDRLTAALEAARVFLSAVPEGFRVGLVTFADRADLLVFPTTDRSRVEAALAGISPRRGTLIGDGLAAALDAVEADRERIGNRAAAILLLSDGRDTGSATTPAEAADRAAAVGVPVFTVVLGDPTGEQGADAALLASIAARTGARTYTAETADELTSIYETLGTELSTRLAIGGSGPIFVAIAAVLAVAAGAIVLLTGRDEG